VPKGFQPSNTKITRNTRPPIAPTPPSSLHADKQTGASPISTKNQDPHNPHLLCCTANESAHASSRPDGASVSLRPSPTQTKTKNHSGACSSVRRERRKKQLPEHAEKIPLERQWAAAASTVRLCSSKLLAKRRNLLGVTLKCTIVVREHPTAACVRRPRPYLDLASRVSPKRLTAALPFLKKV